MIVFIGQFVVEAEVESLPCAFHKITKKSTLNNDLIARKEHKQTNVGVIDSSSHFYF